MRADRPARRRRARSSRGVLTPHERARGELPAFQRVVTETTGLADPAPILHLLMTDPEVSSVYRTDGVVTAVDALGSVA